MKNFTEKDWDNFLISTDCIEDDLESINIEHLDIFIMVMERVVLNNRKFNISEWQFYKNYLVEDESEIKCGTVACAGGYLAMSPEFKAVGGGIDYYSGAPTYGYEKCSGMEALVRFLEIHRTPVLRWFSASIQWTAFLNRGSYFSFQSKPTAENILDLLKHVKLRAIQAKMEK